MATTAQIDMLRRLAAAPAGERTPFLGNRRAGTIAGGWYRTAAALAAAGLATVVREGDAKRATITDAGRALLTRREARVTHTDRSGDAGFVFQSKRTGAVVYDSEAQGLDSSDGQKYTVVCVHNRLVGVTSKQGAMKVAGDPSDLCPACLAGDYTERKLTPSEEGA